MTPSDANGLLVVRDLVKHYAVRTGPSHRTTSHIRAVDGVSLDLHSRETLAIVGESGSGKTTLGRAIVRLTEPTSGSVVFDGIDFLSLRGRVLKQTRRQIQMIFQDPLATLDPRMTVGESIGEGLRIQGLEKGRERREVVNQMLEQVGLQPHDAGHYPHEFSGGQRQRIGIARALAVRPRLIVADEPVSALDVSVAAQVLNLMKDLQDEFGLTYLLIGHNLPIVEFIATRVAVMYLGKLVEVAPRSSLFESPRHPYTFALLSAVPQIKREARRERIILRGDVPNPADPPTGCAFHTRCWLRDELGSPPQCRDEVPQLVPAGENHLVACHFADEAPNLGRGSTGSAIPPAAHA